MRDPAATETADFLARGGRSKPDNQRRVDEASRDRSGAKGGAEAKKARTSGGRAPKPVKPDALPPKLHRMGEYTWKQQNRKLDALFAVYIMGWETKENGHTKWRYWIKPLGDGRWESDMLPHFHDDTRQCYRGIEILRKSGIYITVETCADGYEVVEKTKKLAVRDKDLNFAIMAVCLLLKGVGDKEIKYAWDNQDDWTTKATKRQGNSDVQETGSRGAW